MDPVGPTTGSDRVFRGGSWFCPAEKMRAACRNFYSETEKYDYLGFRCARTR
jgi:formylglycine-generating enzyme required for sulfatase activity